MVTKINAYKTSIYKTSYTIDWELIEPIAEKAVNIQRQHPLEYNGLTSFENQSPTVLIPELKPFYDFILPMCTNILIKEWGYSSGATYFLQNAWFSKYINGGYVDLHEHSGSVAVICLYIKMPKFGGNIEFLDPYYELKKPYVIDEKFLYNEIEVCENDVLIFGGREFHRSQPNLSNDVRWTLTTNVGIKPTKLL